MAECWLWPEAGKIRWWTADATGLLPSTNTISLPQSSWVHLRDGREMADFRNVLPAALAVAIEHALASGEPGCLRLADGLPPDWQSFPFEWLRDGGAPLQGRLAVERHVPPQALPTQCLDNKQIAVLNLWPGDEKELFRNLAAHDSIKIFDSRALAESFMAHADLSQYSLIVVIGHGTEESQTLPLLAEGTPWRLPLGRGLPDVVLLMACGSEDGNLLAYGKTLLDAGAKAVLAPVGKLCAKPADFFLRDFLLDWPQGEKLDRIVSKRQTQPENRFAAWRYCLLGQGAIRTGQPQGPGEWDAETLAEAARQGQAEALRLLAERITLHCYQQYGHLEQAESQLRKALSTSLHDAPAESRLLEAFNPIAESLPALTQAWLLPLLGSFSEAYHHELMPKYEKLCRKLGPSQESPAAAQQYLSKIAYRQGRYPESAKRVVAAFDGLSGNGEAAIRPLGQLLNLLIDLNLVPLAAAVSDRLKLCIHVYGSDHLESLRQSSLDRDARLALRQGQPLLALERFAKKRRKALEMNKNGLRELPWLLYAAAWNDPSGAEATGYARQAKQALADPAQILAAVAENAKGNADEIYLMRALAVWCWRAKDRDAAGVLLNYANFWSDCLDAGRDSGPIGLAVFFMTGHAWDGLEPHTVGISRHSGRDRHNPDCGDATEPCRPCHLNAVEIRNPLPLGEGRVRVTTPTNTTILPELTGLTLTPSPLPQAGEGLNSTALSPNLPPLGGEANLTVLQVLPRIEKAEVNLDEDGYWLELATLFALQGDPGKSQAYLGLFHACRNAALVHLQRLPDWLRLPDLASAEEDAIRIETETLLAEQPPSPARLVETGLLPL